MLKHVKAFSLVELLVVLAIVAIISAIAYPAYQSHVRRAACDTGKSGLLEADSLMNQYYVKYGSYNNAEATGSNFGIKVIPIDGSSSTADFLVTVLTPNATTYTITATATATGRLGSVAKGNTLTINQNGERKGTGKFEKVWTDGCSSM